MPEQQSTEQVILNAARKVFSVQGLQGARMQDIADEAGINKALLHYYFRSKEKLFEIIFQEAFSKFALNVNVLLTSTRSFHDKIDAFVENYIQLLIDNPYLPGFVISEINSQPDRLLDFIHAKGILFDVFQQQVADEYAKGNICEINGKHLFVNIIGMCVFPFIGRPIIKTLLFANDDEAYDAFLSERKQEVKRSVMASLRPGSNSNEI